MIKKTVKNLKFNFLSKDQYEEVEKAGAVEQFQIYAVEEDAEYAKQEDVDKLSKEIVDQKKKTAYVDIEDNEDVIEPEEDVLDRETIQGMIDDKFNSILNGNEVVY